MESIVVVTHAPVYNICMVEGYLTTKQSSERYGLSDSHIRRLLEAGIVIGVKAGRDWLVSVDAMEHYMANRRKPGPIPRKGQPE
jgi:excisionase family DNA binding protein